MTFFAFPECVHGLACPGFIIAPKGESFARALGAYMAELEASDQETRRRSGAGSRGGQCGFAVVGATPKKLTAAMRLGPVASSRPAPSTIVMVDRAFPSRPLPLVVSAGR